MKWKYDTLQITGVTDEEKQEWRERSLNLGYHTLSDYLKQTLTKYKEIETELDIGSERVVISSFSAKNIPCSDLKKRSRYIRYFINTKGEK